MFRKQPAHNGRPHEVSITRRGWRHYINTLIIPVCAANRGGLAASYSI